MQSGEPAALIAMFIYFSRKLNFGVEKLLAEYKIRLNNKSVLIDERLTKTDKELLDYAFEKGLKPMSINSQYQILVQIGAKIEPMPTNSKLDIDNYINTKKLYIEMIFKKANVQFA